MTVRIEHGDCREVMAAMEPESVHCVVTSPPYWGLRCYGVEGQYGKEPTLGEHIEALVETFREVRRVLRKDGTVWLNYGDCYATAPNGRSAADTKAAGNDDRTFRDKPFSTVSGGLKPKDLCLMPARVAIALQEDGWWVRSEIVWRKPNPMPESARDRPTQSHEKIFLLTRSARYFYDAESVRTPAVSEIAKMPDGWETGPGAHGTIHRKGREKGRRAEKRGLTPRHEGHINHTKLEETPRGEGANLRNVWTIAIQPYPGNHFATFPTKLVETCILAGTSQKGCCADCGAPWLREADVYYADGGPNHTGGAKALRYGRDNARHEEPYRTRVTATTGWRPGCDCDAETVPCTVLDPFGGSGTVGLVAERLGRESILIELNPEYVAIARARIRADLGTVDTDLPEIQEPGPLFEAVT